MCSSLPRSVARKSQLLPGCLFASGLLAVSILAGCTSSTSSAPSAPAPATTVTVPRTLSIAAAADLRYALEELIAAFRHEHPEFELKTTYGASGNLFAQIGNGAPFDLFLSADIQFPQQLAERELAERDTLFPYATGHLAVWVVNDSPLDVTQQGLAAVVDARVRKIAIANPQVAPYGRAAEAALKKLDLYDRAQDRLVLGENVSQAAQFVESGAADVGLIALSLAKSPALRDKGRFQLVPADAHPPLVQGGIVLSRCADRAAADEFRSFLVSESARKIFDQYGFEPPPSGSGS